MACLSFHHLQLHLSCWNRRPQAADPKRCHHPLITQLKLNRSYNRDNKVALKSVADLPHQLNQFFLCFLRNLKSLFLESDTSFNNCAPKKSHTLSQGPLKIFLSKFTIYFVSNCKTRKLTFSILYVCRLLSVTTFFYCFCVYLLPLSFRGMVQIIIVDLL